MYVNSNMLWLSACVNYNGGVVIYVGSFSANIRCTSAYIVYKPANIRWTINYIIYFNLVFAALLPIKFAPLRTLAALLLI